MSSEERAAIRRAIWKGGVARSFEELERVDIEQTLTVPPAERLTAIWPLVEDTLALRTPGGPTPRLQRLVGGVRPFRS
jgi:hypothetical protein